MPGGSSGLQAAEIAGSQRQPVPVHRLKKLSQLARGELHVAQNCAQEAGANRFTCMNGNGGGFAIGMLEEYVAPAGSFGEKAGPLERPDKLSALNARKAVHTVTC